MGGKVNLYNLSTVGNDLTQSPIHGPDGAFISSQNALPNTRGDQGGLTKRDGLIAINSVAADGSITGAVNVSLRPVLPTSINYQILLGRELGASWIAYNSAGAFFFPTSGITAPAAFGKQTIVFDFDNTESTFKKFHGGNFGNRLYFASNDYTAYPAAGHSAPRIRSVSILQDGSNYVDKLEVQIPPNPVIGATSNSIAVIDILQVGTILYIAVLDLDTGAPNYRGRVFSFDTITGFIRQVAERFGPDSGEITGGAPSAMGYVNGFLWVGLYGGSGTAASKILRIRPTTETTWTTDTSDSLGGVTGIGGFQGQVYATRIRTDSATASTIRVRSGTGVWSTSLTNESSIIWNSFSEPIVYKNQLYAGQYRGFGSSFSAKIFKNDGTSWANDHTSSSVYPIITSMIYNGSLHMSDTNQIYFIKDPTGTWTEFDTLLVGGRNRGPLGTTEFST